MAAEANCPVAISAFDALGSSLGKGMASLAALLDPEVFVIGGGVSASSKYFMHACEESFKQLLTARQYRPLAKIELAQMGNDAGLIGAADLARGE